MNKSDKNNPRRLIRVIEIGLKNLKVIDGGSSLEFEQVYLGLSQDLVKIEEKIKGNGGQKLKKIKREIIVTNRSLPIPNLFEKFVTKREHIALVVDEYGSVSGLVTMEDVIETLLGHEIMDESDSIADMQLLARKNWEIRAKKMGLIEDEKNS